MRFYLFFVIVSFLLLDSAKISAQLSNGSIAPDFAITDLEGNTHQLYDILDEGKVVILDFFTTWCGPCWTYSQSKELEKIWQKYGPAGSDELFIFYVEHDQYTTLEDLNGTGNNTFGDYTDGITFPIFNDASLNNPYRIAYVPTVYLICPNKRVEEIGQISLEVADLLIPDYCPTPLGTNNGEILSFDSDLDPFCQFEKYFPTIRFQNTGNNDIISARFDLLIDDVVEHTNCVWTGLLPPFETVTIDFESVNLSAEAKVEVRIKDINGELDNTPPNNSIVGVKMAPVVWAQPLSIEVKTDNFGFESYWEILDENGAIIAQGGNDIAEAGAGQTAEVLQNNPNGYYHSDTSYLHYVTLPGEGCYEFRFIDDYGDGICCSYGTGFFKVKDAWGNQLIGGSQRFAEHHTSFENVGGAVSTQDISPALELSIFPNPATDRLSIQLPNAVAGPGTLQVVNTLGQQMLPTSRFQHSGNAFQEDLDVSALPAGLYFLRVEIGLHSASQKFFVE